MLKILNNGKIIYLVWICAFCFSSVSAELRKSVKVGIIESQVRSIGFTSDHNILINNNTDWEFTGGRCPKPEWVYDRTEVYPISQTKRTKLSIELVLFLSIKDLSFILQGDDIGGKDWLSFKKTGLKSTGNEVTVRLDANSELPDIDSLSWYIHWKIIPTDQASAEIDAGTSGPHTVFISYDKPNKDAGVTIKQMRKAIELTKGFGNDPFSIIKGQMARFKGFILYKDYPYNVWPFGDHVFADPANPNNESAECQAIVRFVQAVDTAIGLPGTTGIGTSRGISVYAEPPLYNVPKVSNLTPAGAAGIDYTDKNTGYSAKLIDSKGGANEYEAALEFTYNGRTTFFLGGMGGAEANSTLDILYTFTRMSMCQWDGEKETWVEKTVLFNYKK
jgi:hypothetical protein